jgi:FAS-associated factor 2
MEVDDLTDEQSNALSRFREFTHIDSVETCRQYLAAHEWDVERAIETAIISDIDLPSTTNDNDRITTDHFPSAPPMPEPDLDEPNTEIPTTTINNHNTTNSILQILYVPLMYLYAFYLKIEPFLPWTILRFLFSFVQSLVWSGRPIDPAKEIDDYRVYFDNQYGTRHPVFYRGKLSQALRDAQREVRLLFIYLHEKNSPLCDRFCREVLCEEALRLTIGDHLLWSASIDTQEGSQASRLLHTNSFPCFCIIAHQGSQQTVQLKLDHYIGADEFLAEVMNGVQHADQILQYNRERRNTRNSRDRLLEEQNAAYLDSIRLDQEKAQQRLREENERRKLEEDQRRIYEEQQRKLRAFAEFRDEIKETFPDEPSASETDTIQVSIRLPANEPIRRRFRRTDPAKLLFEFAWTNPNVPDQFELLWGYPRKRYQYKEIGDKQIIDVMKGTTETCYLEQIDEENN